jgi:AAA family ATP:ADP antiporter
MGIAGFIALMTFVSTMLYFQQAHLIAEAFDDRGVRTAFFAKIDLAVNILAPTCGCRPEVLTTSSASVRFK